MSCPLDARSARGRDRYLDPGPIALTAGASLMLTICATTTSGEA